MVTYLSPYQLKILKSTLQSKLEDVEINLILDKEKLNLDRSSNANLLKMFISSKEVEGCSNKTLKYYKEILEKFIKDVDKAIKEITTDEIRHYLTNYKEQRGCSLTSIDNIRRVFSSFYKWLEDEDYISKSPVRRIHKIKTLTQVKEAFSDEEIEKMREGCKDIRELAIIELLCSTGIRVGELINLNIKDMNFMERSCIVLGKGNKQREVYFDVKTKLHIEEYLKTRNDDNEALFVSKNKPHQRLTPASIELFIRELGRTLNIEKAHPHKFRRTCATIAIDKGMPIEQVQKLLGHIKIETTMRYAMVSQTNVKFSHRKYIG
jgi:site-specific recombinase XerD